MGDRAHRLRRSAHNSGNALDVTNDPRSGPDLERLVLELARQMASSPGSGRLRLMIFRRRIWSGPAWKPVRYYGVNPHESHAHIEVRPALRGITRPWRLP